MKQKWKYVVRMVGNQNVFFKEFRPLNLQVIPLSKGLVVFFFLYKPPSYC